TLMGKAQAMWVSCNLLPNCWDEFLLTACYISNCVLVKSLPGITPYKVKHHRHFAK
ncbi:hypothetical protein BS17DRAFT_722130, partial [Gyrodon lividus]